MSDKMVDDVNAVRDWAAGFSTQAKYSNKVWLALVAAAMLSVFPVEDADGIKLPFSLGRVDAAKYQVMSLLILTVLMIGYCQSYATAHIISQGAHEAIANIRPENRRIEARKLYDLLVTSTLARVAPLVQLAGSSKFAAIYYLLLKFVAVTILFAVPLFALGICYLRVASNSSIPGSVNGVCVFALIVITIAVIQILIVECQYIFRVTKLYWTGELKRSSA
jgi:hypothetical protein